MPIIDHIGIAVNTLRDAVPLYEAILDRDLSGVEEVEAEYVRVAFFGEGEGRVELLEATSPDSPIARFIDRHGPGLHHVCLQVIDIEAAIERATGAGAAVVEPGMRTGAGGARVAFLHPKGTGGVLLELREARAEGESRPARHD